ncbi:Putative periplasmic protein-TrxB [hydrothermal vent metagenome]|uniref:Periplasmic protein-TrxB n=1 Tax=hydrothermal vent metagenome TaxID=652676 RepID=A0A3B1DUI1_9ZZZZ
MYDVLIIGAGAAGYGCAITLASANEKFEWAKNKKYIVIDDNNSDISKASFYNLAGVTFGINGDELLDTISQQLKNYNNCEIITDTIVQINKKDNLFEVVSHKNKYIASIVVIATGMHKFNIKCDFVEVLTHNDVLKPNKVCLQNIDNKITDGLYVAGLASGSKTMFAIANGDGVKVACDIFKIWTKKPAVVHDIIK